MELYNELNKDCFVAEMVSTESLRYLSRDIFRQTEKFEEEFQKDIAEMTKEQALLVVPEIELTSLASLYNVRSVIRSYLKWCEKNEVFDDLSNGFLEALSTDEDLSKQALWVKDASDLYESMRKVREFDNGFPEPIILSLAWIGLDKDTAYNLESAQVSIDEQMIYDTQGNVLVHWEDKEITDVLRQYSECKIAERENRMGSFQVMKDPLSKRFIKKYCSIKSEKFGDDYTDLQLNTALHKFSNKYVDLGFPNRLKYATVWESGRLHELWLLEQAGLNVDDKENQEKISDVFRNAKSIRGILWAYKSYKKTFNL